MKPRLIIFDLDETLVHATELNLGYACDFEVPPYRIYLRPHVRELLEFTARRFDVAVWSSSSHSYVAALAAHLFTDFRPVFAWSVSRCVQRIDAKSNSYVYVKDLRKVQKFGYAADEILIVDDSPEKIARQPKCHIHVEPFHGNRSDAELLRVMRFLESIECPV
jgi:RNA polymerase II subunit A small phosphatase-like protein